jgi:hypothetical protein
MATTNDLTQIISYRNADDLDKASELIRETFDLFRYETDEDGNRYRVRNDDNWTPEVETLYMLVIGASVWHTNHCRRQLSLFDFME